MRPSVWKDYSHKPVSGSLGHMYKSPETEADKRYAAKKAAYKELRKLFEENA